MIVVADASVLVAELLRTRGRALLAHPNLRVVVAQEQWEETQHELLRRIGAIIDQGRLTEEHAKRLHDDVLALVDERVIEIIPRRFTSIWRWWPVDESLATHATGHRWLSPSSSMPAS